MKKLYLIIFILLLIIVTISCVGYFSTIPPRQSFTDRIDNFPIENVPLDEAAHIYWNENLIPFIDAQTDHDAAYLLGMVHAHLRLGQMSLIRRVTQGRLSESAGPFVANVDKTIRMLNLDQAVDSIVTTLPDETKNWLKYYVDGLNFYQKEMDQRPIEMKLLALEPEEWTTEDIVLMGRLVGLDINWLNWFQWLPLQDRPFYKELWDRYVDIGQNSSPSFQNMNTFSGNIISSTGRTGSNAFVLSNEITKDGSAYMASDPHLGISIPNTWIVAGYKSPSFHVIGLMFPGVPMVLLGRNDQIAWGGTNMRSASSDLYRLTDDDIDKIESHEEKIRVRWWFDRKVTVRSSRFGPIISDSPLIKNVDDSILSMRWVGHRPSDEFSTFYKLNQAEDWDDFVQAFDSYAVSGQNFLYADKSGNIGMVLGVLLPDRSSTIPDSIILKPELYEHQWHGLIKSTELPRSYNPSNGYIVSANNRPVVNDPPIGYFFSANDRVDRISSLIEKNIPIELETIHAIQQDTYVESAYDLHKKLVVKMNTLLADIVWTEGEQLYLDILKKWDGYYNIESQGALAFQLFTYYFATDYYKKRYDEDVVNMLLSSEFLNTFLFEDIDSEWNEIIKPLMISSIQEAAKTFQDYENWGDFHRLNLAHPLGMIPIIGKKYQFGNYPIGGTYNSSMKTAHNVTNEKHNTFYGANSRFIAKMADINENYFVLLGGQDGWIGSDYISDQVPLWLEGKYIKFPFQIDIIREEFPYRSEIKVIQRNN